MSKLNVMHVADFGAANPGNFIGSLLALEDELKARGGGSVYVLPSRAKEKYWAKGLISVGKKLYYLSGNMFSDALLLNRVMKENDITIIHSHFAHSYIYLALRLARIGRFRKTPYFVHVHSQYNNQSSVIKEKIQKFIIAESKYICVSKAVSEPFIKRRRSCSVVYNSIDFSRLENYEDIREEIMAGRIGKLVLMFGYNFRIKGVDIALKAFNRYDTNHRYTLGIIVTNHIDEAYAQIEAMFGGIPEWVRLLPARDDVASYYKAADIFLSASRTEGFPYALVEAAYCGTTIAATDIPGQNELNAPGLTMFQPECESALFHAVDTAACADTQKDEAREYVSEHFPMKKWTNEIIKIYEDLTQK